MAEVSTEYEIGPFKWGATPLGTAGGQVTWSFATQSYGGYTFDNVVFDSTYQTLVREALQAWENVANIDFVEMPDDSATKLRFGWDYIDGSYNVVGEASVWGETDRFYNSADPRYSITSAEIRFDTAENWSPSRSSTSGGAVNFYAVALHEIGHALGLRHTDDPYTIMYPMVTPLASLEPGDVAGAQAIYGPPPLAQLFAAHPATAEALSAAYATLIGGVPNEAGYRALIDTAEATNFGAGPGPVFNEENIFINLANSLVQGNTSARSTFGAIADGATLAEKIGSIYAAIIPQSAQTADGLAFLTRPDGIAFYQQVAAERGVSGDDGAAIVAMAALLKIAIDQDIGIGNAVNDLLNAVATGSHAIPDSGSVFTDIEVADGNDFDEDDAAAAATVAAASASYSGPDVQLAEMPVALLGVPEVSSDEGGFAFA